MKLSRTTAKMSIIFFNMGVLVLVMGISISNRLIVSAAALLFGAAFIIRQYMLRCPSCGHPGPLPSWKKSEDVHCRKCGEAIEYDE